jgi:hypothetical protein
LFYLSSGSSSDNFKSYILHRLLTKDHGANNTVSQSVTNSSYANNYEFTASAQVIEKSSIFVPTGWDSLSKIKVMQPEFPIEDFQLSANIDYSQAQSWQPIIDTFGKIVRDFSIKKTPKPLITSSNEDDFLESLEKIMIALDQTAVPEAEPIKVESPKQTPPKRISPSKTSSIDDVTAKLAKLREKSALAREKSASLSGLVNETTTKRIMERTGSTQISSQNEVLASFFSSLLSKKSTE